MNADWLKHDGDVCGALVGKAKPSAPIAVMSSRDDRLLIEAQRQRDAALRALRRIINSPLTHEGIREYAREAIREAEPRPVKP